MIKSLKKDSKSDYSSDKNFTLHPEPGTELTVDLDATSITIPVVGGEAALKTALE